MGLLDRTASVNRHYGKKTTHAFLVIDQPVSNRGRQEGWHNLRNVNFLIQNRQLRGAAEEDCKVLTRLETETQLPFHTS